MAATRTLEQPAQQRASGTLPRGNQARFSHIGRRADAAEQQADVVASRVTTGQSADRAGHRAAGLSDPEPILAADARSAVERALASPGEPLPGEERRFFEPRLGVDLAGVRIHASGDADRAAGAVRARAFTLDRHIVFARNQYRPGHQRGRRLLAHELAHVALGHDRDGVLRRDDSEGGEGGEKKDEKSGGKVIVEGLAVAAEKAAKKKEVKEKILKPLEDRVKAEFGSLSTGEKAGTISFGAATYGLGLGSLLGTEKGRKLLSDVNFIAPLQLIPNWPITSFTYKLPESEGGPMTFKLKFDGTDLLKLGRKDARWFTSLSMEANWTVLTQTDTWKLTQLTGSLGLYKGVTLSGGYTKGPFLSPSNIVTGPGGEQLQSVKTIPKPSGPEDPLKDRPNVGGFVTVDLTKLPIIPEQVRRVLGGDFSGVR